LYNPIINGTATCKHDGQHKQTLLEEKRALKNARRRAAYKKKRQDEGYSVVVLPQEQRDKINERRRATYQTKNEEQTNPGVVSVQEQRGKVNARRRETYRTRKRMTQTLIMCYPTNKEMKKRQRDEQLTRRKRNR
jgi:hypothetical protein